MEEDLRAQLRETIADGSDSNDETYRESNVEKEKSWIERDVEDAKRFESYRYPLESELDPYRLNRFRGSSSTWREFTREERQNARALETIRSSDLAAHVYNAHVMHKAAREGGWGDGPSSISRTKAWTAWPMPAGEVPLADERLRREEHDDSDDDDNWTFRKPSDDLRPSAELEEALIAVMLNHAKKKFEARSWKKGTLSHLSSSKKDTGQGSGDQPNSPEGSEEEIEFQSGQASEVPLRPVLQADDDISRRQLRPLARHVIAQFDQLLLGLHRARMNDASLLGGDHSFRGTGRTRSRKKRPSRTDPTLDSGVGDETAKASRQSGSEWHSTRATWLGLRDWGQVLGIASLAGLPSETVIQTAKRCSDIFQSDMEFRELREGTLREVRKGSEKSVWKYSEDVAGVDKEEKEEEPMPPMLRRRLHGVDYGPIVCPFTSCKRHTQPFSETYNLTRHLKTTHPEYFQKYLELYGRA